GIIGNAPGARVQAYRADWRANCSITVLRLKGVPQLEPAGTGGGVDPITMRYYTVGYNPQFQLFLLTGDISDKAGNSTAIPVSTTPYAIDTWVSKGMLVGFLSREQ